MKYSTVRYNTISISQKFHWIFSYISDLILVKFGKNNHISKIVTLLHICRVIPPQLLILPESLCRMQISAHLTAQSAEYVKYLIFSDLSGIFLPGTELLQSLFRTEFSMGSRSRRYRRSLRRHRRFLLSYCRFLRSCRRSLQRWRDRRNAGADAATPFVARLAKHHKTLLNIVRWHETHVKHREPLVKHHETLKTLWNIMKQSSFDATISALDVEMSAFGAATSAIAQRSFDATISALDAETSSLDADTSALGTAPFAIARSYWRYRWLRSWYNSPDV